MQRTRNVARLVACAVCLFVVACAGERGHTFKGTGPTLTRAFAVDANWQMQWEFTGQVLRITVLDEFDERVGTEHQQGTGRGAARYPAAGTYSLELLTEDLSVWTIHISQAP